jgi:uncharacterized membrane protein
VYPVKKQRLQTQGLMRSQSLGAADRELHLLPLCCISFGCGARAPCDRAARACGSVCGLVLLLVQQGNRLAF